MPTFALAVVPAHWNDKMPLTFSQAQYEAIGHEPEPGTSLILFQSEPTNAVIGQGQVRATFLKTSEWPPQNLGEIDPADPNAAYLLPIEVLFLLKGALAPVSQEKVREILEDAGFPHGNERWRPLTPEQYDALRDGWT